MSRVLPALAALVLTIYCVVDCVQTDDSRVRHLPKIVWLLMILLFPVVGPAAWLLAGRERTQPSGVRPVRRAAPPSRQVAPDDDPRFLAGLDKTNEERRRLAEWERELRSREEAVGERGAAQSTDSGTGDLTGNPTGNPTGDPTAGSTGSPTGSSTGSPTVRSEQPAPEEGTDPDPTGDARSTRG